VDDTGSQFIEKGLKDLDSVRKIEVFGSHFSLLLRKSNLSGLIIRYIIEKVTSLKFLLICLFIVSISNAGFCQKSGQRQVIQFTGVVFGSDSTNVVPGVHIYIPKNGRGTTTNPYGFFSMPVLEGDSVVFSAVGYHRTYYIIPEHDKESSLKIVVFLADDITFLEEVEIRPYPTESAFREALITMELPHQKEYANIYQWLNSEYMTSGYQYLPVSLNTNAQYLMNIQQQAYINRYSPPVNNFLNPFAWAQFINSLKKK